MWTGTELHDGAEAVERAIDRGVRFLASRQLSSGEFSVLTSRHRAMTGDCSPDPSVFPTALAAQSLALTPAAAAICNLALDFLEREMDSHGLWRHWTRDHPHRHELPPDADDTAVASAALVAVGRTLPPNREILLANRDSRGLFFTWITPRLRWTPDVRHWKVTLPQLLHPVTLWFFFRHTSARPFDIDAVVNANVVSFLGDCAETQPAIGHLLDVLRTRQESDCDKWYESPFAVWYFFSRALHASAPEAGEIIAGRILEAAPETALDFALAACSLLHWRRTADAENLVAALLDAQLTSGAWPRAGLYHGGRTRRRDGSFEPRHPDTPWWGSEELTTVFAIEALTLWQIARS